MPSLILALRSHAGTGALGATQAAGALNGPGWCPLPAPRAKRTSGHSCAKSTRAAPEAISYTATCGATVMLAITIQRIEALQSNILNCRPLAGDVVAAHRFLDLSGLKFDLLTGASDADGSIITDDETPG